MGLFQAFNAVSISNRELKGVLQLSLQLSYLVRISNRELKVAVAAFVKNTEEVLCISNRELKGAALHIQPCTAFISLHLK